MKTNTEKAHRKLIKAQNDRLLAEDNIQFHGKRDFVLDAEADRLENEAKELMTIDKEIETVKGGEVSSEFKDTLDNPNWTNAHASYKRLELASKADCFDLALDVAETIGAKNSLEKMMAHQMAACHQNSMKMIEQVNSGMGEKKKKKDADLRLQRITNMASKLMTTFQQGMKTLHQIRNGGQQKMTVEHVNVHKGGKAVVGNIQGGGVTNEK